uniref:Uncharacterized protein n=1 Tax=Anopheles atroparvus TaxID=41427 RepID=A0AAG5DCR4_ANOAO
MFLEHKPPSRRSVPVAHFLCFSGLPNEGRQTQTKKPNRNVTRSRASNLSR